jgi:hypothetical protein
MLRDASPQHHVGQCFNQVLMVQAPLNSKRQALPRVLVDQRQNPQQPPVMGSLTDEVVAPDLIGSLRSQPNAARIVQP